MSIAKPSKKTVYIDVDEEITGIIDKVRSADEQILALVLPKRASMLQSIVNMKLLKRSADQSEKRVVLITSESTLLPLAGTAGLHVADNLQSRPYIPSLPGAVQSAATKAAAAKAADVPIDPNTAIGDLAETKNAKQVTPIEIDNSPKVPEEPVAKPTKSKKAPKDKTKKVPNFNKFRLLLIGGGVLFALLLIGGYYAFAIAPKATITLRTESSQTPTETTFSADTDQDTLDLSQRILPAKSKELKKTESEKVAASGTRDDGTKAIGSITLRNCLRDGNSVNIPAGTGISNGSLTYITQQAVQLDSGNFNGNNQCKSTGSHTGEVKVTAQNNGDQYNLTPRSFTVAGFPGIVAENSDAFTGGATKTTRIVAQADVDAAKKRISDRQNTVVEEVKNSLKDDNYIGLVDTFSPGKPTYTPSPAAGSEATEVTVSADVTYTMLGVREDDLKKIIVEEAKGKIDTSKQSILNYGLDDATYEVGSKKGTSTSISVKSSLLAGPEIDQDAIKESVAGKSSSDAQTTLKARPGITDANISFKPFWVKKIPGKAAKVTLVVEQANGDKITQ